MSSTPLLVFNRIAVEQSDAVVASVAVRVIGLLETLHSRGIVHGGEFLRSLAGTMRESFIEDMHTLGLRDWRHARRTSIPVAGERCDHAEADPRHLSPGELADFFML